MRDMHEPTYGACGFRFSKPLNALCLLSKCAFARVSLSAPPHIALTIFCPEFVSCRKRDHQVSGLYIEGDSVDTILVDPIWNAFLYGPFPFGETKKAGPVPDAQTIHDTDFPASTEEETMSAADLPPPTTVTF